MFVVVVVGVETNHSDKLRTKLIKIGELKFAFLRQQKKWIFRPDMEKCANLQTLFV